MSAESNVAPQAMEYRTEVKQLLDILAHSLYTDREIFLRELISNASDALNRIQFEMLTNQEVVDPDAELAIYIQIDEEAKRITIRDSGIGMNHDELIEGLGTIAHSGAKVFLNKAAQGGNNLNEIIGQFGVGFYSVFMVADQVTVTSRSYQPADQPWSWRSDGGSSFELMPAQQSERGTTIIIDLKEDAAEFANAWRIEGIVKKHSDYVSFPIYLVEPKRADPDAEATSEEVESETETRILNRQTALWRQSPSKVEESEYNDFYKQLTFDFDDPLARIHLVADAPVHMRCLLFVPTKRARGAFSAQHDRGIRLYSRKILIQEQNRDLLPDYLRFVEGVVDSEDLPLNVSREMVQSNPVMRQLRRALTNRVTRELSDLATNDAEKYSQFWSEFGLFLKEGVATEPSSQETLVKLLRFRTTQSEEAWVSLSDYVTRMDVDQPAIYYVLGDDLRSAQRSPHLDYFRANDIEVLYLVDPIDGYMTTSLREVEGKPLRNVDDAGLDLPASKSDTQKDKEPTLSQGEVDQLITRFKRVLGDRVTDVRESKQLVTNPCRLVSPEDSFDRDLQRLRRLMEEDYETPKKLLEINRAHPLVVNLTHLVAGAGESSQADPLIDATIEQLFDNALLLEGLHPKPAEMVERVQQLMEAAIAAKASSAENGGDQSDAQDNASDPASGEELT